MDASRGSVDALDTTGLNTALAEATCLGVTADPAAARIRMELEVLTLPAEGQPAQDSKVHLTLTGVSRVAASLRVQNWDDVEPQVFPLTIEGLGDAIASFGGSALHGWEFIDVDDSSWSLWRELLSFDTELSDRPAAHVLEFSQQEGVDPRELDVRVWFENIEIATADGRPIAPADFVAGGQRWWKAHDSCDPRTMLPDVAPPM
ncbi:hypothetical protein NDR87_23430 [Nocardia sp. CDC159]|uniref:Uncharacterized protein n=1 Tax=Nocardia pulmonis TaxID=2951408 RepID=A0A9X2IYB5_9NOCA|nr:MULTISPECIES: hypothetical protein [Nocardia]MCM6776902.1 hypothetical protein [Nocardia pulmonis]MCM6789326.1 hypothetical protein [Nocardia sp. CDC159]